MKLLSRWMQRLYILGFLLFAWHIAPFSRFTPAFPVVWSVLLVATAWVLPGPVLEDAISGGGAPLWQALLAGALVGSTAAGADWSHADLTLLYESAWALTPLFLFDRLLRWGSTLLRRALTKSPPPHAHQEMRWEK